MYNLPPPQYHTDKFHHNKNPLNGGETNQVLKTPNSSSLFLGHGFTSSLDLTEF